MDRLSFNFCVLSRIYRHTVCRQVFHNWLLLTCGQRSARSFHLLGFADAIGGSGGRADALRCRRLHRVQQLVWFAWRLCVRAARRSVRRARRRYFHTVRGAFRVWVLDCFGPQLWRRWQ